MASPRPRDLHQSRRPSCSASRRRCCSINCRNSSRAAVLLRVPLGAELRRLGDCRVDLRQRRRPPDAAARLHDDGRNERWGSLCRRATDPARRPRPSHRSSVSSSRDRQARCQARAGAQVSAPWCSRCRAGTPRCSWSPRRWSCCEGCTVRDRCCRRWPRCAMLPGDTIAPVSAICGVTACATPVSANSHWNVTRYFCLPSSAPSGLPASHLDSGSAAPSTR